MLMRAIVRTIKRVLQLSITSIISALHLENLYISLWNRREKISILREKILQFPRFNPLVINVRTNNQKFKYFTIPEVDDLYDYSRRNFYGWEDAARQIFYEWCTQSQIVIDVGAYSGVYTALAGISGGPTRIICFEPNPRMIPILEKNIEINIKNRGRVTVNKFGLSSMDGQMWFAENEHTSASQIVTRSNFQEDLGNREHLTKDRVAKLDSLEITEKIDLIKVDIEGHEVEFLNGSFETLSKDKPIILMEALDSLEYSKQKDLLRRIGYTHVIPICERNGVVKNYLWIGMEIDNFLDRISTVIQEFGLTVEEIK